MGTFILLSVWAIIAIFYLVASDQQVDRWEPFLACWALIFILVAESLHFLDVATGPLL